MGTIDKVSWDLHIIGEANNPDGDQVVLIRHDSPQIRLGIDAPGIQSAGEDQKHQARQAIRDAVTAIQQALASPSGLPGFD